MTNCSPDYPNFSALEQTGERLLTNIIDQYAIEHLHRYAMAMSIVKDKDVLDIASGEGYGSNLLCKAARFVYGIDIDENSIKHAKQFYKADNLMFIVGSANCIPLESQSVDIVVSFETLEHHNKHEEMLTEIKRILRPDGALLMSTPDTRYFGGNPFHVKELDLEQFRSLIQTYFKRVSVYFQKFSCGSIVEPELLSNNAADKKFWFKGDFDIISKDKCMVEPTYNICLASDEDLPPLSFGFFNGNVVYEDLLSKVDQIEKFEKRIQGLTCELNNLRNSRTFKVGLAITKPFRKISGFLKIKK